MVVLRCSITPSVRQSNDPARALSNHTNSLRLPMKALQRLCPLAGLTACVCLAFFLAGCESRSISDSSYRRHGYYGDGGPKTSYRGELNEFDVLGVERGGQITEEQIVKSLDSAARIKLRKGSSILLIPSGALQT